MRDSLPPSFCRAILRDPAIYPDLDIKPERFLNSDGSLRASDDIVLSSAFGYGYGKAYLPREAHGR
ncbi:hypothetical protein EI94DRAFT_1726662 [Lactarius quietus]|nr:hypothetical protein EI94DRAFT_1726662 [Lactarius quietus]